jgi:translation initiation factor 3 subunit B
MKPKESDGVENVIVIDGIPEVGDERLEKLKGVIRKLFGKFGNVVSDQFPLREDGVSKGYGQVTINAGV